MRDRILAVLRDKQTAHPGLGLLADDIVAAVRGDVENVLSAWWDEEEEEIVYHWPVGGRAEVHLLYSMFVGTSGGIDIVEVFKLRGYDVETLEFRIERREGS